MYSSADINSYKELFTNSGEFPYHEDTGRCKE